MKILKEELCFLNYPAL
ncbi:rCG53754, partial [Rattus norvegicus]